MTMKSSEAVAKERERLYKIFMDPSKKKPIRDEAYIKYHTLTWVLEDEKDVIKQRLDEINAARSKTSKT